MSMAPEMQAAWDSWADAKIEARAERTRDALGDALGHVARDLRREIAVLRDSPPLFSAPDKKLSAAMVRVGEELHALQEAAATTHTSMATFATEGDVRQLGAKLSVRLGARLDALERASEIAASNVRGINTMIFNLASSVERLHALVARFAAAADCERVLDAVDESKRSQAEERKKPAVVLRLQDLRQAS
jgi:hypothetical protein